MNSNPFSTRFIRPGSIAYRFENERQLPSIVKRIKSEKHGQIIGPHGSGKSTLVHTLRKQLANEGHSTPLIELHDGQRCLTRHHVHLMKTLGFGTLFVDGYEQLGLRSRWRLGRWQKKCGCGLVITTHKRVPLPVFCEIVSAENSPNSATLFLRLAEQLQLHSEFKLPQHVISDCFNDCHGNYRDSFFALYDQWQRLAHQANSSHVSKEMGERDSFECEAV